MSEQTPSRRRILASLGAAGASMLGAGLMANSRDAVAGDGATVLRPGAKPLPPGVKSVQGSWVGTLELPDGSKRFGLATFTPNGGMTTTGQGDILNASPQGSGHGAWVQDGLRVDHHIFKFVGDASGALVGIYEEVASGTLDASGDSMVTDAWFNVRAMNGTVVREGAVTIRATRVTMSSPSPLEL
jgi:hypothetical protein